MTQPKRWQTEVCPGAGDAKVTQAQGPQSQLPRNLPPASAVVPARLCGCRAGGERVPLCRRRLQDRSVSACRRLVPDLDLAPGPLPRPTHIHTYTHTHTHAHTHTHPHTQTTHSHTTHTHLPSLGRGVPWTKLQAVPQSIQFAHLPPSNRFLSIKSSQSVRIACCSSPSSWGLSCSSA